MRAFVGSSIQKQPFLTSGVALILNAKSLPGLRKPWNKNMHFVITYIRPNAWYRTTQINKYCSAVLFFCKNYLICCIKIEKIYFIEIENCVTIAIQIQIKKRNIQFCKLINA